MVYIVGVDHLVQYDGPVPEALRREFKSYLLALIRDLGITLIAEEFSRESLVDVYGASEGTAEYAAASSGITHRYCDPEDEERSKLGIPYYRDIKDDVMRRLGLPPGFILDPLMRRRVEEETNVISRTFWDAREEYWLERIRDFAKKPVLFICGWEHCRRFRALLERNGIAAGVIEEFWRRDDFRDYDSLFSRGSCIREIFFKRSSSPAV